MAYVTHRNKTQSLHVIVLTDVLFFLQENNNKYSFFTFTLDDNKDNNKRVFLKDYFDYLLLLKLV